MPANVRGWVIAGFGFTFGVLLADWVKSALRGGLK